MNKAVFAAAVSAATVVATQPADANGLIEVAKRASRSSDTFLAASGCNDLNSSDCVDLRISVSNSMPEGKTGWVVLTKRTGSAHTYVASCFGAQWADALSIKAGSGSAAFSAQFSLRTPECVVVNSVSLDDLASWSLNGTGRATGAYRQVDESDGLQQDPYSVSKFKERNECFGMNVFLSLNGLGYTLNDGTGCTAQRSETTRVK